MQHLYACSRVVNLFMGFAHGLGFPPSFDLFAECKGALSLGSLQAPTPEALFYELSASTESPVGPGSTVSKQRSPPLFKVKGSWPAADCCVSGPLFFDYSFLCDSDDEELAGIVELCHSPPPCSRTPRRHRTPLLSFVGKTAPTRKARTQLWRTRVAKSNRKFRAGIKKGTGKPRPAIEEPCTARFEEGIPPPRPVPRPQLRVLGQSAGGQ